MGDIIEAQPRFDDRMFLYSANTEWMRVIWGPVIDGGLVPALRAANVYACLHDKGVLITQNSEKRQK